MCEPAAHASTVTLTAPSPTWSATLAATPSQVRHARTGLAAFLGCSLLTPDAVTCVSELVTNSIQHSNSREPGGTITVRAALAAGQLRVEVEDQGGHWRQPAHGAGSLSGRGLHIVAALAQAWGKTGDGTHSCTVWFTMTSRPNTTSHPLRHTRADPQAGATESTMPPTSHDPC